MPGGRMGRSGAGRESGELDPLVPVPNRTARSCPLPPESFLRGARARLASTEPERLLARDWRRSPRLSCDRKRNDDIGTRECLA